MAIALFFLAVNYSFAQTSIRITYYNSTTQDFAVQTDGKLYFYGNNLLIKTSASASDTSIPMSIISKVAITDEALSTNEIGENKIGLKLYPNPSSDFIKISSNVAGQLNVNIYSINGQLVKSGTYASGEGINISQLSPRMYLVQANGSTIKFLKK